MVKALDLLIDGNWIVQSVADRRQESLTLDFKSGKMFDQGRLTNDGRKVLGPALSAFANSAGGVLVIGVDARKNTDGVDCAQLLVPIGHVERALTDVSQAVGELLQPRHDGIEAHYIISDQQTGEGFIVVAVPRSDRRPHMSQPQRAYFKRAGTSNFQMEHYDVEDAFRRQTGPDLRLEYELLLDQWDLGSGNSSKLMLTLACTNQGSGSARNIAIRYALQSGVGDSHAHIKQPDCHETTFRDAKTVAYPFEMVVHPGATRAIRQFFFTYNKERGRASGPWSNDDRSLSFAVEILAEGMRPLVTMIKVYKDQILEVI